MWFLRQRKPSMARARTMVAGGAVLLAAKGFSVSVLAGAYAAADGDWWRGAFVALACLAPSAAAEAASLWSGWRLAHRFVEDGALSDDVRAEAHRLGVLLYLGFFAALIGLTAAGHVLDLGMAVAAPALAPLAPLAVGSGALRLLSASVRKGAEFERQAEGTI